MTITHRRGEILAGVIRKGFMMDEEKVKKAIKASTAPKEFFRHASALGLFAPYRDSHLPLTEFSNELKYQMPEWLGFVRDAMEDRFFSIISDTEPRRGRLPNCRQRCQWAICLKSATGCHAKRPATKRRFLRMVEGTRTQSKQARQRSCRA